MNKIVIISKTTFGLRAGGIGLDGRGSRFKKPLSALLQTKIADELKERSIACEVMVDNYTDDSKEIKKNEADLILISPYLKGMMLLEQLREKNYYILSEKEFLGGDVEHIMKKIISML